MPREFTGLTQLLDHIATSVGNRERVSLGRVVRSVGRRSFAPLLLLVGIILFSPLSAIPGIPTAMAILVLLVAVQLLFGRSYFWLPQWALRRSISRTRLNRALHWLQGPAQFIDRWLRPRLVFLVGRSGTYVIAVICTIIAMALPAMEVVPFSATVAGMTLTVFGLALMVQDGLLAVLAFVFTGLLALVLLLGLL